MRKLNPSIWALGLRSLWRDWRAGELTLLLLAVTLAVAALTAVGFFADRLQGGLQRDARQLLGGDLVVRSDQPLPPSFLQQAQALGLQSTAHLGFPTMARAPDALGGATRLVALKAVAAGYPLRGQLRVADQIGAPGQLTQAQPEPGSVWVESGLLDVLGLQPGQSLLLGDASLRIAGLLLQEPDRGAGFLSFAPRVLMNQADLVATGLVQPASRIDYRLALVGDDAAVQRFRRWVEARLTQDGLRGVSLESLDSGRPEMQQTLERAEKFLNLVALLAALLSAVAVAMSARLYALRHLDDCAMLRVLGLSQAAMARAYSLAFGLAGLIAGGLGVLIGYAVHHGFVWLLADLIKTPMPAPSLWPVWFGLGVGLTLMLAFGLPPVLQLSRVPPLRVIRRELGNPKPLSLAVLGLGALGFAGLLLAASRDLKLGAIAVGGFALALGLFALLAWLVVRLLRRLLGQGGAPSWLSLAVRQWTARPGYAVVQVSSLAVGLLALVLLVLLRTDLVASWRAATPVDAPNRFVINIQPDQQQAFRAALEQQGVSRYDWYPMIRGRLVTINGRPVNPQDYQDERARRLAEREFNLSHSVEAPGHNRVVAGRWQANESDGISIESGLAETLGLKLGDRLGFDIAGMARESVITSLRQVDWSSMRVNFFAIYPVGRLPGAPLSYISAFRAPDRPGFDATLLRAFPNLTLVDLSQTLAQVQQVLGQVIRAVEALFGFTLLAGLVVLFAAIAATRGEREREFAILRALGARSSLLRRVQRAELLGAGLLAGTLASGVAVVVGWVLARQVFGLAWHPSPWVPLAGALSGALLALAAGWWGLRGVLRAPVAQTLRRAAD
ncbi:FtsX-like permease family protein [Malikia sp.]|uniref:ABC transporter permease n=1 Tax=Malikia sp. TaxID=2070706 RepID=UPI00263A132B|nr:FtsX-like permease family protein [Malikia sp.]